MSELTFGSSARTTLHGSRIAVVTVSSLRAAAATDVRSVPGRCYTCRNQRNKRTISHTT